MPTKKKQCSFYLDEDLSAFWKAIPNQFKTLVVNSLLRQAALEGFVTVGAPDDACATVLRLPHGRKK